MFGDLKSSTEVVCQLLEKVIQTVANGGLTWTFDPGMIDCNMSTGCCPKPLAITSRVMLPESSLVLMNISHLWCGPVGVRFTRPPRLSPPQADDGGQVEPAMTGVINAAPTRT